MREPKGVTGAAGRNATKLFAYIADGTTPSSTTASVQYGSGVTALSDPSGGNAYTVMFDRSGDRRSEHRWFVLSQ